MFRYVDITEAIDTNDPRSLDNSDFRVVDAIPMDGKLPSEHYADSEVFILQNTLLVQQNETLSVFRRMIAKRFELGFCLWLLTRRSSKSSLVGRLLEIHCMKDYSPVIVQHA